jgi:hypothetical protein
MQLSFYSNNEYERFRKENIKQQQVKLTLQQHFKKQKCIPHLLTGRPRQRIINFYQNNRQTLFDRLLSFCNE